MMMGKPVNQFPVQLVYVNVFEKQLRYIITIMFGMLIMNNDRERNDNQNIPSRKLT